MFSISAVVVGFIANRVPTSLLLGPIWAVLDHALVAHLVQFMVLQPE